MKRLLKEADLIERTGLSKAFFRMARSAKASTEGPPYIKIGAAVRYDEADVDAWLERNRIESNSRGAEADVTPIMAIPDRLGSVGNHRVTPNSHADRLRSAGR